MVDRDNDNHVRTSYYLVRRAEALLGTLRFFTASANATECRLQFLAQSDFWEWEMENLIYSFTNHAERSETWRSPANAVRKLNEIGIVIESKVVDRVRWRHGGWRTDDHTRRVAPTDLLRETIDEWNKLVDLVETQFVKPFCDKAERFNIQTARDLNHLRKTMPAIDAPA
jgi:hypothetical protein